MLFKFCHIDILFRFYTIRKPFIFQIILLLNYLKDKGFTNCIKTKEYVDMAEFEKHLYAGVLDKDELEKFKDRDYKQALYYKRIKHESKNN